MPEGLTDKQAIFCEEYLIDLNGTRAYKAAYKVKNEKTASVNAARLLANAKISSHITALKTERSKRTEITADYVLSGLKEVAERCLQKSPVMKWDYEAKAMVQVEDEEGRDVWTFDSGGANRAFELLGKHVGLFGKDNDQKKVVVQVGKMEVI
jgi:phage terminase small subunit